MNITSQITVGNSTGSAMVLDLPIGTWTASGITDGVSCLVKQYGETRLHPIGGVNNPFILSAGPNSGGARLGAVYCTASSGGTEYVMVDQGMQINNYSGVPVANGTAFVTNLFDNSRFDSLYVAAYGVVGLNISDVCCGLLFTALTVDGNNAAGSLPLLIGTETKGITFANTSIDHPGAGEANIRVVGPDAHVAFVGMLYMESNPNDTTTPIIQIMDPTDRSNFVAQEILSNHLARQAKAWDIQNFGTGPVSVVLLHRTGVSANANCFNELGFKQSIQCDADNYFENYSNRAFGGLGPVTIVGNWVRASQFVADQGTSCTNSELTLSPDWGSSPRVTGVAGAGQTCKWTITSGIGSPTANPRITDTLTNKLPTAATVCRATFYDPATGTSAAVENTVLSQTAPVFTVYFMPRSNTAYRFERTCGP